jgi:hypothetical protein
MFAEKEQTLMLKAPSSQSNLQNSSQSNLQRYPQNKREPTQDKEAFQTLLNHLQKEDIVNLTTEYPKISITCLNEYLSHNPLETTKFRTIGYYEQDEEGTITPQEMVVLGKEIVVAEIALQLGKWNENKRFGGRMTTAQGAYHFKEIDSDEEEKLTQLIPDVALIGPETFQSLTENQLSTYREAVSPIFVVEVDTLTGPRFAEVDRKMKIFFEKGQVRLAWAIDPENMIMYVYSNSVVGGVPVRSNENSWRDLDGGEILPGFVVLKKQLDRCLSQEPLNDEKKELVAMPCPRCPDRHFWYLSGFMEHLQRHQTEDISSESE